MGISDPVMPSGTGLSVFDDIDSTNALALRAARKGQSGPHWFLAKSQSAGRGRQGRIWHSEAGSLYASLLICVSCKPEEIPQLSFVAALGVHDALIAMMNKGLAPDIPASPPVIPAQAGIQKEPSEAKNPGLDSRLRGNDEKTGRNNEETGANDDEGENDGNDNKDMKKLSLKWPNDILLDGKKLAGILLETSSTGASTRQAVIGIGLNLAHCPEIEDKPATCLADCNINITPQKALSYLAASFDKRLRNWRQGRNFAKIRKDWLERAEGIGKAYSATSQNKNLNGVFENIDKDGALILRLTSGERRRITSGEVHQLKSVNS